MAVRPRGQFGTSGGSIGGLSGRLPGSTLPGGTLPSGGGLPGGTLPRPGFGRGPNFGSIRSADELPEIDTGGIHWDPTSIPQQVEAAKRRYKITLIRRFGMNEMGAEAATEIAWSRKKRGGMHAPMSALSMIGRGLKVLESAPAGFHYGMTKHGTSSWNPWDQIRAFPGMVAGGGKQAWKDIRTGRGFGEEIRENEPKGSFVQRHAGSVGLGMSIVFDPTTYLSGGATAVSKIAARQFLHDTTMRASRIAAEKLEKGGGVARYFGRDFNDHLELTQAIREANRHEYPLDMGDALDMLRAHGMDYKEAMRRGQVYETVGRKGEPKLISPSPLRRAGAFISPYGVKGGRGIRLAGMEVPGTAAVTEGIGRKFRTDVETLMRNQNPIAQGISSGFVTNAGLRAFGEDTVRALALTEMTAYRTMALATKEGAKSAALEAARAYKGEIVGLDERMGALDLAPEREILPHESALRRAFTSAHEAEFHAKDVPRGDDYAMFDIDPNLKDQLLSETAHWRSRKAVDPMDKQEMVRSALGPSWGEGGNHLLTIRGPDGTLRAVGSFSDYGSGTIDINAVAAQYGAGGTWLRRLAQEYPDHEFRITPLNEEVKKYYKEMGAKIEQETSDPLDTLMYFDRDQVNRIAAGEDPRPQKYRLRTTPQVARTLTHIRKGVQDQVEAAVRVGLREKDVLDEWQAIKKSVKDPVEAYAQFWFKNQMKVRSREFQTHLLNNPLLAKPIKKGAELPQGYKVVKDKSTGQRYQVLAGLADSLEELVNPQVLDKSMDHVLHMLSIPQNYWKQFATSANPSFHVMNFLGAFWNNLYAGIYNPADYVRSLTTLYQSKMYEAQQAGRTKYMGRATTPRNAAVAQQRAESAELVKEARIRGATSENASIYSYMAQEGQPPQKGMETFMPPLPQTLSQRLNSLVRKPAEVSQKRFALTSARRASAVGLAATGNVPLALALAAPEAAKVGRVFGNTIEDVVRLAPFMKASKDPVLLRYMDAYGPIRVPGMVHPGWTKTEQASMYDIGAAISKQFQFDYSDLTVFERRMAKLIFPFYTFNKKNFMLQVQMMAQAPRGVNTAQSVMNYLNDNGDISPEFRSILPAYFDQIQAFQVPVPDAARKKLGLPSDMPLFLNPKLPFMSLNLIPPLWQMFQDTGQPTNQKVLGQMSSGLGMVGPFSLGAPIKVAVEAAVGQSLGLNKPLDYQRTQSNNYRESYVPAPSWVNWLPKPVRNVMGVFPWMGTVKGRKGDLLIPATGKYILDQMATPFVTNLGQSIPYEGQDPGKARADMVSWMTGIRLIPVDALQLHRSYGYQLKSILEAERNRLKAQGKEMPVQDQEALNMTRDMLDIIEEAWDTRDAELHGTRR